MAKTPVKPPAVKRATFANKPQAKRPVRELSMEEMVQKELGWDPRITVYVTDNVTLRRYQRQKGKFFTQTSIVHKIGGYNLQQVGAWRENENVGDKRIVWVEAQGDA